MIKVFALCCLNLALLVSGLKHADTRNDDVDIASLSVLVHQQSSDILMLQADVTAMKNQLAVKDADISDLKSKMADLLTPVILSALTSTNHRYQVGDIVKFGRIVTDTASIYDSTSGIFTIPRAGSYIIYVRPDPVISTSENLGLDIKVNNVVKMSAFADHGIPSSGAVTLRLTAGDRVWASVGYGDVVEEGTEITIARLSP